MYTLTIDIVVDRDIERHLKAGDKLLVKKIFALLEELKKHPKTGTGKPERMKYVEKEQWTRHINDKHRLIYEIQGDKLIVIAISAYGHYGNK